MVHQMLQGIFVQYMVGVRVVPEEVMEVKRAAEKGGLRLSLQIQDHTHASSRRMGFLPFPGK